MTDDTCSPPGAPLDASHLTPDQEQHGAAQVRHRSCHAVTRDPVPLAEALAELIAALLAADSDPLPMRKMYWRMGYAAAELAHADDYEAGYHDGVMAFKAAQHDAHRLVQLEGKRWELRGEKRSRDTFARPHAADHRGRDGAA